MSVVFVVRVLRVGFAWRMLRVLGFEVEYKGNIKSLYAESALLYVDGIVYQYFMKLVSRF